MLIDPWMMLNATTKGVIQMGNSARVAKNMNMQRAETPSAMDTLLLYFEAYLKPSAIPVTVDSSARAFMEAPMRSPLLARIAAKATKDVKIPGTKPYKSRDRAIGIPVKSNLRTGSGGKGILRLEYFRA